jgi:ABC-2 type transport system permease protein
MQWIAKFSPITYALEGMRAALLDGATLNDTWPSIWPLLIMGAILVPAGLLIFRAGERYAKRTGLLKRSG